MGRKTPVDRHSEAERLEAGFAVMYREEEPGIGHVESGVKARDPQECPKRARYVDVVLARLKARAAAPKVDAVLESTEERVG